MLIGNVTVSAFWKVFADRTGDSGVVAHAQRLVTITDWVFTLGGIVLIIVGGYGAVLVGGLDPFKDGWIVDGEVAFLLSGLIWLGILVPTQIALARDARGFAGGGAIPEAYWRRSRRWLLWGIVATVPLVAATFFMVAKP